MTADVCTDCGPLVLIPGVSDTDRAWDLATTGEYDVGSPPRMSEFIAERLVIVADVKPQHLARAANPNRKGDPRPCQPR